VSDLRAARIFDDGRIEGILVVGGHGHLSHRATPSLRSPVYRTSDGRFARIAGLGPEPDIVQLRVSDDVYAPDAPLPGIGFRVGPWPANLNRVLLTVGEEERTNVSSLAEALKGTPQPTVLEFLRWLEQGSAESSAALFNRTPEGICVWYCSKDEHLELRRAIAKIARTRFLEAAESRGGSLERAAWWLSRAALDDDAVALAVTGLRLAGVDVWQDVFADLMKTTVGSERTSKLASAERKLAGVRDPLRAARSGERDREASKSQKSRPKAA
jgi:hypothetical protein